MGANLYSKEYEKTVLGMMLIDNSVIDLVCQYLKKDCFYFVKYGQIFEQIVKVYTKEQHCDLSILTSTLKGKDVSYAEVADLTSDIISSGNCEFYVSKIKEMYFARTLRKTCSESANELSVGNINEIIGKLDTAVNNILSGHCLNKRISSQDMLESFMTRLQKSLELKTEYTGVDCGYPSLNDILDGLPFGELTIIGARPAIGKTAFALNLLTNIALKNYPVAFFSLEMSSDNLMQRIVTSETGISKYFIDHGVAARNMSLINKIQRFCEKWDSCNVSVYDSSNSDKYISTITSLIRNDAKNGKKVFFIDHLGLVRHSDEKLERYKQVHEIVFSLHNLAQQLNVCIIVLCQLRRDSEGKKPSMKDFRESGDIEQDVDNAILMHRDRGQGNEDFIETEFIVEKHRNGATGTAVLDFVPKLTKFMEQNKKHI